MVMLVTPDLPVEMESISGGAAPLVAVGVGVAVGVEVAVLVAVGVGVAVAVGVAVGVGVGVAQKLLEDSSAPGVEWKVEGEL